MLKLLVLYRTVREWARVHLRVACLICWWGYSKRLLCDRYQDPDLYEVNEMRKHLENDGSVELKDNKKDDNKGRRR